MFDVTDVFLNDTSIPDVFITDYMSALTPQALQVYLMANLHKSYDKQIQAKPIRQALGLNLEDFKAAVCDLVGHNIVETANDFSSFVLLDLKRQALDRHYRRLTSVPMKETVARTEANQDRQKLIKSINDTYFHGLMGPIWYQTIDTWFEKYDFESSVVYQIFVDAADRNALDRTAYVNKMAEDYSKHGVKSFGDLTHYKEEFKRVNLIANQIGRKLNKQITKYDLVIIEKWVVEYSYDFEVIDVALAHSVRLSQPNLNYFDRILTNWHEAGIRTAEEARRVEENNTRYAKRGKRPTSNGNFEQRDYNEEVLDQYYQYAYLEETES